MELPQEKLLDGILAALPREGICTIDDPATQKLAAALRTYYAVVG